MVSERLNGIGLMHFHQEIIPDTEKVIDLYAGQPGGLIWHKSYFYINAIFVENGIVIVFTFNSSFPREAVDSL